MADLEKLYLEARDAALEQAYAADKALLSIRPPATRQWVSRIYGTRQVSGVSRYGEETDPCQP